MPIPDSLRQPLIILLQAITTYLEQLNQPLPPVDLEQGPTKCSHCARETIPCLCKTPHCPYHGTKTCRSQAA
jgi:hypothetical protein